MTCIILAFGLIGLAVIGGMLIADMRASAAHQRWIEENNKRRHGIK